MTGVRTYVIGQSRVNDGEVVRWLSALGVPTSRALEISQEGTDAERMVALPAKRCYNSFVPGLNPNVTRTRSEMADYLGNLLRSRHGSTLEHASWTVAVEGCTRVFTAEANRHRAGVAISEASMRYVRFGEGPIPYWEPICFWVDGDDPEDVAQKKTRSKEVFRRAFEQMRENYSELESIWAPELAEDSPFARKKELTSAFRRIIGMGARTGVVYTWNCRAMRHILELRCSPAAEEEIREVMHQVLTRLRDEEPNLFGDFDSAGKPTWSKV